MECFVTNSNEIESRLDCHFYRPEFTRLDKKVKSISKKKLADYILSISSGATPDIKESEKYYSDSTDGIPFLRVQNVTPVGLNFDNLKFINKETHNGMLKRSQVSEFNLLVKITGVGRMAVSSFAPKDFIGNINQHLVVIKTESENASKILAVFLNSDIGERLATKRATGGTRPALDYEALKSIPIVFKPEIVDVYEKAITRKMKIESEAQKLLDSINDYVLDGLGIKLPKLENKMCYVVDSENIDGAINPERYRFSISFKNQIKIKDVADIVNESFVPAKQHSTKIFDWLRIDKVRDGGFLSEDSIITTEGKNISKSSVQFAKEQDVLLARLGPSLANKKILIAPKTKNDLVVSNEFIVARPKNILPEILVHLLKSDRYLKYILSKGRGETPSRLRIDRHDFAELNFPKLDDSSLPIQNEIAEQVKKKLQKAEQLQKEAKEELERAKKEVEKVILGER